MKLRKVSFILAVLLVVFALAAMIPLGAAAGESIGALRRKLRARRQLCEGSDGSDDVATCGKCQLPETTNCDDRVCDDARADSGGPCKGDKCDDPECDDSKKATKFPTKAPTRKYPTAKPLANDKALPSPLFEAILSSSTPTTTSSQTH